MEDRARLLLEGARYGDVEDVETALANGDAATVVNTVDAMGRTALHMASANGHIDVVRALVAHGADATAVNREKNTALHWACLNGHAEVAALLLAAGASATAVNAHDRTPVDEALAGSHDAVVDAINAHVDGKGGIGSSAHVAAGEEDPLDAAEEEIVLAPCQ